MYTAWYRILLVVLATYFTMIKTKLKMNTAHCDKFLGNTPRNLIWNDIDYILYNVVRRAIVAIVLCTTL